MAAPALEPLADAFDDLHLRSVFVYTREAHPGERIPHHETFDDKLARARQMATHLGLERRILVDDLAGTVHRGYGTLPNMCWLIRNGGRVVYRAGWTDARTIRLALEGLRDEREQKRAGRRLSPYFVEWEPQRSSDPSAFMDGLLLAGDRAVDEFIEAIAPSRGERGAQLLREWWAKEQASRGA